MRRNSNVAPLGDISDKTYSESSESEASPSYDPQKRHLSLSAKLPTQNTRNARTRRLEPVHGININNTGDSVLGGRPNEQRSQAVNRRQDSSNGTRNVNARTYTTAATLISSNTGIQITAVLKYEDMIEILQREGYSVTEETAPEARSTKPGYNVTAESPAETQYTSTFATLTSRTGKSPAMDKHANVPLHQHLYAAIDPWTPKYGNLRQKQNIQWAINPDPSLKPPNFAISESLRDEALMTPPLALPAFGLPKAWKCRSMHLSGPAGGFTVIMAGSWKSCAACGTKYEDKCDLEFALPEGTYFFQLDVNNYAYNQYGEVFRLTNGGRGSRGGRRKVEAGYCATNDLHTLDPGSIVGALPYFTDASGKVIPGFENGVSQGTGTKKIPKRKAAHVLEKTSTKKQK